MKKFILLSLLIFYNYGFCKNCKKCKTNILLENSSKEELNYLSDFNNMEYVEKINNLMKFFKEEIQYKLSIWDAHSFGSNNEEYKKVVNPEKKRHKKNRHTKDGAD